MNNRHQSSARARRQAARHIGGPHYPSRHIAAFSVLEVIVSISAIAILVGLLLVSLKYADVHAARNATLTRVRSHVQVFAAYSIDYADQYPLIMKPTQKLGWVTLGNYWIRADYFYAKDLWPAALAPAYYDGDAESDVFRPAETVGSARERLEMPTGFWYSHSFLADPKYWNLGTRTGDQQLRSIKQPEVKMPSRKVLFYTNSSHNRWTSDEPRAMGFVDGSAAYVVRTYLKPGVRFTDLSWSGGVSASALPGMQTLNGVHGRDID